MVKQLLASETHNDVRNGVAVGRGLRSSLVDRVCEAPAGGWTAGKAAETLPQLAYYKPTHVPFACTSVAPRETTSVLLAAASALSERPQLIGHTTSPSSSLLFRLSSVLRLAGRNTAQRSRPDWAGPALALDTSVARGPLPVSRSEDDCACCWTAAPPYPRATLPRATSHLTLLDPTPQSVPPRARDRHHVSIR